MTGPEHYREAERLEAEGRQVVSAIRAIERGELDWRERRDDLGKQAVGIWAQAQIHATLSLAAATALAEAVKLGTIPPVAHGNWIDAVRPAVEDGAS